MNDTDRATCAVLAGLLRAAGVLALWGFALSAIAALVLALTLRSLPTTPSMAFGAVAILGVLERYFAFRLRLDQALFDDLARGTIASLEALDQALARLGLRADDASSAARPLADRAQGTRQLLQRHAIVVACQSAMFLLALMTQDLT
ncbi:hypothetical protein [Variovorax sp.]|jgi:hypothetical protein|uniref:hypothetical protein n=1 Tax=Variovorax sp. TaxID=1871043 RepID=UPI001214318C|nr:hypothetical protein [Variovorax sp.]TAJ60917.1 MAG: hypothetical protein EPO53_24910 [Variovorax sp.]